MIARAYVLVGMSNHQVIQRNAFELLDGNQVRQSNVDMGVLCLGHCVVRLNDEVLWHVRFSLLQMSATCWIVRNNTSKKQSAPCVTRSDAK